MLPVLFKLYFRIAGYRKAVNEFHAPKPAISILDDGLCGKSDAVVIHLPGKEAHGHCAGDCGRIFTREWESISRHTVII